MFFAYFGEFSKVQAISAVPVVPYAYLFFLPIDISLFISAFPLQFVAHWSSVFRYESFVCSSAFTIFLAPVELESPSCLLSFMSFILSSYFVFSSKVLSFSDFLSFGNLLLLLFLTLHIITYFNVSLQTFLSIVITFWCVGKRIDLYI